MALTLDDVHRIAHLARIHVEPGSAEANAYLDKLNSIVGLIDELKAVDTGDVAPMAHPQDVVLRLREDRVSETDHRDAFQAIAPQVEAGLYLVPKVIE